MKIECEATGLQFAPPQEELEFLRRIKELNPAVREALPFPQACPSEALRRMSVYGNLLTLFKDQSALSGRQQITRFNPRLRYRICTEDEFWSDQVDNRDFGAEYDFSRSFFEQWNDLMHRCHLLPLRNSNSENCSFCNGCDRSRNCCLCFDSTDSENSLYCMGIDHGLNNVDCIAVFRCSYCYSCTDCDNCYECQHCADCRGCSNCFACKDCHESQDCTACWGLRHARWCYFNEQLDEKRYHEKLRENSLGTLTCRASLLMESQSAYERSGHQTNRILASEDCSGSFIRNSKNAHQCFHLKNTRDCGYVIWGVDCQDCWKGTFFGGSMNYYGVSVNCFNTHFSYAMSGSESCWYSYYLYNGCSNCFGCVGLKKCSYCILNRQYSKEDYNDLVPRIAAQMKQRGEWGRWFPLRYAPHYYDEGWADDYFEELPREELERRGYRFDPSIPSEVPDRRGPSPAEDISLSSPENTLATAFQCRRTAQSYNIQKAELEFYRRYGIPLPQIHWRERLRDLARARPRYPHALW